MKISTIIRSIKNLFRKIKLTVLHTVAEVFITINSLRLVGLTALALIVVLIVTSGTVISGLVITVFTAIALFLLIVPVFKNLFSRLLKNAIHCDIGDLFTNWPDFSQPE